MKTILVDAYRTLVLPEGGLDNGLLSLVNNYANQKIVVTNATEEQKVEYGIDKVPFPVFSMSHNPNKPDPVFFITLLKEYDLVPEEVVYFEHNADAVASARSVGITAMHFDHTQRDLLAVKDFLDKNL